MNKKTIRIAGWALGLSMAVAGVGAAMRMSAKTPIQTKAVEQAYYTLSCLKQSSTDSLYQSAYANTATGDFEDESTSITKNWTVPGNTTLGGYWRIGGKGGSKTTSVSSFDRVLKCNTSFDDPITSVKVNHSGLSNAGAAVNNVTLTVASNDTFTSDVSEIELTPSFSVSTAGYFTFTPTAPTTEWAKDRYYKITFNMTLTGKSNYGLDLTSIVFYHDVVSSDYATNLSASPSSISPNKGSLVQTAINALTVTAQKNGAAAAAYSNYSAKITRRDNTEEDVNGTTVFKTGDKNITLTANDPTELNGDTYSTCTITTNVLYTSAVTVGNSYAMVSESNVFNGVVTSNIGGKTTFDTTPAAYGFIVENGLYDGTVALKLLAGDNTGKYIAWTGTSAQLTVSDTKTLLASWVVYNDGEDDITASAANENATLRFNTTRFCGYTGDTGSHVDYRLLGTANLDTFNAEKMKMSSYDPDLDNSEGTNACYGTDGKDGYYATAKSYYNDVLSTSERALLCDENGLYADAYERLQAWAKACGERIDSSDNYVLKKASFINASPALIEEKDNIALVITLISACGLLGASAFLVMHRRKEN